MSEGEYLSRVRERHWALSDRVKGSKEVDEQSDEAEFRFFS